MITGQTARMLGIIYNRPIRRAYSLLHHDDTVTVGSIRIRAIASPDHTPGSMSFLVDDSVLFVGDAFKLQDDKICPPRANVFNMDTETQKASIRKLAGMDNVLLACTAHTGCTARLTEAFRRAESSTPKWLCSLDEDVGATHLRQEDAEGSKKAFP